MKKVKNFNFQSHFQVRAPWAEMAPKPKNSNFFPPHPIPHPSVFFVFSHASILSFLVFSHTSCLMPHVLCLSFSCFLVFLVSNWSYCPTTSRLGRNTFYACWCSYKKRRKWCLDKRGSQGKFQERKKGEIMVLLNFRGDIDIYVLVLVSLVSMIPYKPNMLYNHGQLFNIS